MPSDKIVSSTRNLIYNNTLDVGSGILASLDEKFFDWATDQIVSMLEEELIGRGYSRDLKIYSFKSPGHSAEFVNYGCFVFKTPTEEIQYLSVLDLIFKFKLAVIPFPKELFIAYLLMEGINSISFLKEIYHTRVHRIKASLPSDFYKTSFTPTVILDFMVKEGGVPIQSCKHFFEKRFHYLFRKNIGEIRPLQHEKYLIDTWRKCPRPTQQYIEYYNLKRDLEVWYQVLNEMKEIIKS